MSRYIARRGYHEIVQTAKVADVLSKSLLENGQNRVIDASLTLIREKAKLKASNICSFIPLWLNLL